MMKKNYIPMNENEVTEEVEAEVVEEEKEESKVKGFFKNNWKKFAVGAGVALAGIGGYILGSSKSDYEDEPDCLDMMDFADQDEGNSEE